MGTKAAKAAPPQWREVGRRLLGLPRIVCAGGSNSYVQATWEIIERRTEAGGGRQELRTREIGARPAYAYNGGPDLRVALAAAAGLMPTLEDWASRMAQLEALDRADWLDAEAEAAGDEEDREYAARLRKEYGRARELWDANGYYLPLAHRMPMPCGCNKGADTSYGTDGQQLICRGCSARYRLDLVEQGPSAETQGG